MSRCSKGKVATYLEFVGNLGTHAPGLDCLNIHLHIGQACCLAKDVDTLTNRKVCHRLNRWEVGHLQATIASEQAIHCLNHTQHGKAGSCVLSMSGKGVIRVSEHLHTKLNAQLGLSYKHMFRTEVTTCANSH